MSRESISSATRCRVLWDILERTQPGYHQPNFRDLIAANQLARLRVVELGMAGLIAGVVSAIYYRAMLRYSFRGDVPSVQLVMKNFVLYAAVLTVTFGVATPKSRLRAALIVGPLALLPFVILLALCLVHPGAMGGLARWTTPLAHLSIDALFLTILAVGSACQAGAIHRLRREVADARRLGPYRLQERIGAGGMGEVYLAEHQFLKRPSAVKLIRTEAAADGGRLKSWWKLCPGE